MLADCCPVDVIPAAAVTQSCRESAEESRTVCDIICKEGLSTIINGPLPSLYVTVTEYLKWIFYEDKKFALISDLEVEIQQRASSTAWL